MSFYLLNTQNPENDYTTGKRIITAHFECDTVSDLPALVQSTYIARIGSTAHIIENNSGYAVKSNGVWCVQETGTDVYTRSEIDTLLSVKASTATTLAGYGITNAYTKTQTDTAIANAVSGKITIADVFGVGGNPYIPDNSDMNTYTAAGVYIRQFSSGLSDFQNLPMDGTTYSYQPFKLIVEYLNSPNNILQTIVPTYSNCGFFKRCRIFGASGTWQTWKYFEGV